MKIEIYHGIINCLENIRMHLKLSQLKFAAYFSFTREGYRLAIAKDTNKNKTYVKLDVVHILATILYNLENYDLWKKRASLIIMEIKSCFTKYYQKLITFQ
ncbi:hypothetical protein [Spiroplasma sp. SV19]|uniref:hypothetical protein n=1 Tax=Spiroplasma sp. SV19 TaxID=2570468 RepID=UPI0024B74997|nr:hypothetical protein [Spiroplasma sp. SV19]WHQ37423.1 hypothetical protein E7Y35_06185 [Spiroplasma sp. SV19]